MPALDEKRVSSTLFAERGRRAMAGEEDGVVGQRCEHGGQAVQGVLIECRRGASAHRSREKCIAGDQDGAGESADVIAHGWGEMA